MFKGASKNGGTIKQFYVSKKCSIMLENISIFDDDNEVLVESLNQSLEYSMHHILKHKKF